MDPPQTSAPTPGEDPAGIPGTRPLPRGRRRLSRKAKLLIAGGVIVFVAVSGLLARFLQTENVERDADLALIEAQARGDANGMLNRLSGCRSRPACVAAVQANIRNPRLRRKGEVKILQLKSATAYSPTGATGETRFAWTVIGQLPVVQCIEVRRSGNFLSGIKVTLLAVGPPIPNEADC